MTSLLTTAVDESCHNHLRGRRRSSVHPLSAVPRLFIGTQATQSSAYPCSSYSNNIDECAVSDDIELTSSAVPFSLSPVNEGCYPPSRPAIPNLSPLSHAHMSDYAPKMIVPRHHDRESGQTFSAQDYPSVSSPTSTTATPYTTTAANSRKPSLDYFGSAIDTPALLANGEKKEEDRAERMRWRLAAAYFAYFMCGWGDGVTGTVLPFFMADFHMTFTTSSLLFAANTCGFLTGSLLVERVLRGLGHIHMNKRCSGWIPYIRFPHLGRKSPGKKKVVHARTRYSGLQSRHIAVFASSLLHASFFIIMGTRGGFPSLFAAYTIAAFSRAILTATLNAYLAIVLPQSIGYAYAFWSIGGAISPIVCQAVVAKGVPWFQFYFGSLVLSAFNTGFLMLTYRPTLREWLKECHEVSITQKKNSADSMTEGPISPRSLIDKGEVEASETIAPKNALQKALRLRYQWAFSVFSLLYCATETTTQGFMVSYLLKTRNANPKTIGYVTSGFWAGITIGRLLWGYILPSLDFTRRKYFVHCCLIVGLALQVLIWFVKSNIGDATFASIIGLVYGPMFPAALALANALLPEEVHMVSMALISTGGSIGAAIFPFIAGTVSNAKGVHTLTYVTVPLAATLVTMWIFFPSRMPNTMH